MAQIFYRSGTTLFDRIGRLAAGARIYFHPAVTLDQLVVYRGSDLSPGSQWTQPVECDGYGLIPPVYLDDASGGSYRYRVTTAQGMIINDLITVPLATIGGGGGGSPDPSTIFQTGWTLWLPFTDVVGGWVKCNGMTIGDGGSSATQRANADCQALFTKLWNGLANAEAAVVPSRGVSAANDWAAKKIINVPDLRGRAPFGLDAMGGPAAGRLTGTWFAKPTTPAASGGVQSHQLTAPDIPAHTHGVGTLATVADGAHDHEPLTGGVSSFIVSPSAAIPGDAVRSDGGVPHTVLGKQSDYLANGTTSISATHTHTITGLTGSAGGGGSHQNLPPMMVGTYHMKL